MARGSASDRLRARLRKFGLAYPGAHLKSPWPNHKDLAVNDKTFCYLSVDGEFSLSCRLPHSCDAALQLPFTKPTNYGLGRWGWVTATCPDDALPPAELLEQWIDESYRKQAPKRLVKQLAAREEIVVSASEDTAPAKKRSAKKEKKKTASKKKAATKKKATANKRTATKRTTQ